MASEFKDSADRAAVNGEYRAATALALLFIGEQLEKLVELQEKTEACEAPAITLEPEPTIDLELLARLTKMSEDLGRK